MVPLANTWQNSPNKPNLRQPKKNQHTQKTQSKNQDTLVDRPGNGLAYSIQAPGPHWPGYRLADSPVSCRQLEADTGTLDSTYISSE